MSYKYSTGSVFRGDIYYEDDRLGERTYIDFGHDTITLRPSGSAILFAGPNAVGIGTTSPGTKLHVKGDDARVRIDGDTDSHPGLELSENGTRKWIIYNNYVNDNLTFKTNSDIRLSIEQDGNVGIGTTDPITTLDTHFNSMAMDNDTGGGWVVKFGSGTLTAGKLYYLHTDGAWTATDADAATTGGDQLLGIALGTAPGTHGVLLRGFFDAHTYLDTHTSGKAVYISVTAGEMTITAPSATGDIIRIIGYCTSQSKVIYFNPSSTFVELS
jgi:hypothetical protein